MKAVRELEDRKKMSTNLSDEAVYDLVFRATEDADYADKCAARYILERMKLEPSNAYS